MGFGGSCGFDILESRNHGGDNDTNAKDPFLFLGHDAKFVERLQKRVTANNMMPNEPFNFEGCTKELMKT